MASLVFPNGERRSLTGDHIRIGRDPFNDLALLNDPKVSRSHAELRNRDGQWFLLDLGSSNGTKVNNRRVDRHPLRDGDRIQMGSTRFVFTAETDPHATEGDTDSHAKSHDLSAREREVVRLVAQGMTDREIAERLFISPSTVRSHLDRISEKTNLRRRAELTRLAMDLGLLS